MRAVLLATTLLGLLACSAPGEAPPPTRGGHPIVGHVRLRDRTIELTVDTLDARGGDVDLRRATAHHEPEVWADTDPRLFEPDDRL